MKNNRDYATFMGRICGGILITCLAACICGIALALTLKFLIWIF